MLKGTSCLIALAGVAVPLNVVLAQSPGAGPASGQQSVAGTAASAAQPLVGLQEIVVTAERRNESIQNAPLAITAISGEALSNAAVVKSSDLNKLVPDVHIVDSGTQDVIRIRGVGTQIQNALQDPQIAFSVDGVFISSPSGSDGVFYDLDRVEVLKGPQGTLYGRNATGGALNVITARPKDRFEANAGIEVGNYHELRTNGMLNLPLTQSTALRFAFLTVSHEGYLTSGYDDARDAAGRVELLTHFGERASLLLTADYFHQGGMGINFVPLNPVTNQYQNPRNPWQDSPPGNYLDPADQQRCVGQTLGVAFPYCANRAGRTVKNVWGVMGQYDYRFDGATLTVIPAFRTTNSNVLYFPRMAWTHIDSQLPQGSIEARLASTGASRLQWLVGVYGLDSRNDADQLFFQPNPYPHPPYIYLANNNPVQLTDRSFALFTQETYSLTNALRFTLGGRYTYEGKTKSGNNRLIQAAAACDPYLAYGATYDGTTCSYPERGSDHWNSGQYRVALDYDVTAHSLLYASVSTGEHAGGFFQGLPPDSYGPETLTAYALGSKNRFLDQRVQVNGEIYYWDFRDLQYTTTGFLTPPIIGAVTLNAGRARVYGADASVQLMPTRFDQLSLDVSYAQGQNTQFRFAAIAPPIGGSSCGYNAGIETCNGSPLISLPPWAGNFRYQHTMALPNGSQLRGQVQLHAEAGSWLGFDQIPAQRAAGYHQTDVDISYTLPRQVWTVGAFVHNIEDVAVRTYEQPGSITRTNFVTLAPPRTYGLRLQGNF